MSDRPATAPTFPSEALYWVGVDAPADSPVDRDRIFEEICALEGLDDAGLTRLELARPDPRGDLGPRYLASFAVAGGGDLAEFAREQGRRVAAAGSPGELRPRWRLAFERIFELVPDGAATRSVQLIGMSPSAGATNEQVEDFNDFYNRFHLPEVMAAWDWHRGSRYELRSEILHPAPGCPRFLAIYEIGDDARETPTAAPGSDAFTQGPAAFLGRNTVWRLRYDLV